MTCLHSRNTLHPRHSSPTRLIVALLALAGLLTAAGCTGSGASTHRPAPTTNSTQAASSSTSGQVVAAPAIPSPTASTARPQKPGPCATNTLRRFVRVSLTSQHLWMCAGHTVAYSSPITSGIPTEYTHTPTGHFHIQSRNRNTVLTLNTGKQYDVKYWIPFQAPLFGFHDSPWQTFPYGSRQYRTDGSHGCVHLPLKTIAFLYRWADVGTDVTIA